MDETTLYNSALSPVGFYMKIEINTVRGRRRPRPARRRGSPAVRPLTSSNTVGHGTRDTVRTIQYSHMVHTHERPRIKLSACPRCARALQYHCLTPMLTPVWYHSAHAPSAVHGPARDLGCPSALRHTATAPCSVKLLQVGWLRGGQAPILQPRTSPTSGSGGSQLFALGSPDVLLAPCQARAQLAGFRRVWIVRAREPAVRI